MKFKFLYLAIILFSMIHTMKAQNTISLVDCYCGNTAYPDNRFFKIHHYLKIDGHTEYGERRALNGVCSSTEFISELSVVADGTPSSVITIKNFSCAPYTNSPYELIQMDDNFEIIGNNDQERYGKIELTNANGNRERTYKFTHPKIAPDPGTTFREFFLRIGTQTEVYALIKMYVYRQPVAMIHGLWSNSTDAFGSFYDYLINSGDYEDKLLNNINYEYTNDVYFSINNNVVRNGVENLIFKCLANGIACGKVNIVCHSMGGLLTRSYMKSPLYASNNDINRVITSNTPHGGSQMANFLLDPSQYGSEIATLLNLAGMSCYNGAVSDLRVGLPAINGINFSSSQGDQEVHAIITNDDPLSVVANGSFQNSTLATIILSQIVNYCGSAFLDDIFDMDTHDGIVASGSQAGGLTGLNTSVYPGQLHVGATSNASVMEQMYNLLNSPPNTNDFANDFNTVNVAYTFNFPCLPVRGENIGHNRMNASIDISSPINGANYNSGDTLTITYTSAMVDTVMAFIRYSNDSISLSKQAVSSNIDLIVPGNKLGETKIILYGINTSGNIVAYDTVMINAITSAIPTSLKIYPRHIYLKPTDSIQISATAVFNDGYCRNILDADSFAIDFIHHHASYGSKSIKLDTMANDTAIVSYKNNLMDTIFIYNRLISYAPNCKMVTNTSGHAPGSLSYALECARTNDTIYFDASLNGDTIYLDSVSLVIDKNISIINNNLQPIVIKGSALSVFNTVAGNNIYLKNVHIISDTPLRVAINNYSNLSMENVLCKNNLPNQMACNNVGQGVITLLGQCYIK